MPSGVRGTVHPLSPQGHTGSPFQLWFISSPFPILVFRSGNCSAPNHCKDDHCKDDHCEDDLMRVGVPMFSPASPGAALIVLNCSLL